MTIRYGRIPEGTPAHWVDGTLENHLMAACGGSKVDLQFHLSLDRWDPALYRETQEHGVQDPKGRAVAHLWVIYQAVGTVLAYVWEKREDGSSSLRDDLKVEHEVGRRYVLVSSMMRGGKCFGASHEDKVFSTAAEGRMSWYSTIGQDGPLTKVAEDNTGLYKRTLHQGTLQGETIYVEYANAYDDSRETVWAPASVLQPIIDAKARKIPKAEAREYLEKYSGCVGADLYRRALEIGTDEPEEGKA